MKEELKMAKHNYSQYSNTNKKVEKPKLVPADLTEDVAVDSVGVIDEPVVTPSETVVPEVKMVTETVETIMLPKSVTGEVANCYKLNIRVAPVANARIEAIVDAGTKLTINVNESTDDWFKITTESGVNGYCMKKFVDARL
jgi:hypothetical protein